MIVLQHFTSLKNWEEIRTAGFLALTESHVHPRKPGPPVLWLTTRTEPGGLGLDQNWTVQQLRDYDRMDKERIMLTVELPRTHTHKWLEWAPKHGGDPQWVAHVRATIEHSGSWRVHTRPVPRQRWLACRDLLTGKDLSIAPTLQQLGFKKLHARQR